MRRNAKNSEFHSLRIIQTLLPFLSVSSTIYRTIPCRLSNIFTFKFICRLAMSYPGCQRFSFLVKTGEFERWSRDSEASFFQPFIRLISPMIFRERTSGSRVAMSVRGSREKNSGIWRAKCQQKDALFSGILFWEYLDYIGYWQVLINIKQRTHYKKYNFVILLCTISTSIATQFMSIPASSAIWKEYKPCKKKYRPITFIIIILL